MKKLSIDKLVETIHTLRKKKGLTQAQLADATGINRAMIGRIENKDYIPTVEQMQTLGEILGFEVVDMFLCDEMSDAHTTIRPLAKLRGHIKITDTSNQRKTKGKTLSAISVFFGKNTETFYKAYSMLYINSLF